MSEKLGESLSALVDGEASQQDLQRVLENLDDEAVRDTWSRFQSARHSLNAGASGDRHEIDLSRRIKAAIELEPGLDTPAEATVGEAAARIRPVARWQHFSRPLASFAVAASVFAAVLVGSQYYGALDSAPIDDSPMPADRVASGGVVGTFGGAAVRADFATPGISVSQPVSDYDALARDRLQRYLLPHAEEAALNGNQGMMPFAKVASFEIEE